MIQKSIDYSVVQSKQVAEMLTVANEYCLFMEELDKFDLSYITEYLQRVLPLLYLRGSLMPETEPHDESDNERFVIEETWEYLYNQVMNLFGKNNLFFYWDGDLNDTAQLTVSEILADLYQDLKDFVMLYAKPAYYAKVNSVHMCRQLYKNRWGKGVPLLLYHLHGMIFENDLNVDDHEF